MSSNTSSVHSPPFTPVRSKNPAAKASRPSATSMLLTPGQTPVTAGSQNKNRFGSLGSPVTSLGRASRSPLSPRSQNVASPAPAEANWRVKRKPIDIKVPVVPKDDALLPSPFHSTHRRTRATQPKNEANAPVTPARTPLKSIMSAMMNVQVPPTPEASPFRTLSLKDVPLILSTPPRLTNLPLPASPVSPLLSLSKALPEHPKPEEPLATCAACNRILSSAALLSPCMHLVCSPCFTGCLNAAGDKTMDCMACKTPITTFKLSSVVVSSTGSGMPVPQNIAAAVAAAAKHARAYSAQAPVESPLEQVVPIHALGTSSNADEPNVLRIDNVPWDVTPEMLSAWIGDVTPPIACYALIDRHDGRTLSYAYVEVSPKDCKTVLRDRQNTILGRGKRARAVTVTLSSQSELMREMFPTWQGHFLGSKPCVVGMNNSKISQALSRGLLSPKEEADINSLLRKPDSHFVKVPSLPYHHLAGILRKFPVDKDSKVLHTPAIKTMLTGFVQNAASELHIRADKGETFAAAASEALVNALSACNAFEHEQRADLIRLLREDDAVKTTEAEQSPVEIVTPVTVKEQAPSDVDLFELLADTHKIDAGTIRALTEDLFRRLQVGSQDEEVALQSPTRSLPAAWLSL